MFDSTGDYAHVQLDRDRELRTQGRFSDSRLEGAINDAYNALISAQTNADRQLAVATMATLIAQRSPEQVRRMELSRGLLVGQARDTTYHPASGGEQHDLHEIGRGRDSKIFLRMRMRCSGIAPASFQQ